MNGIGLLLLELYALPIQESRVHAIKQPVWVKMGNRTGEKEHSSQNRSYPIG
jgi:hypothetical protein